LAAAVHNHYLLLPLKINSCQFVLISVHSRPVFSSFFTQIFHTGTMRFLIFNYGNFGSYGNPQLGFGCGTLVLICVISVHQW